MDRDRIPALRPTAPTDLEALRARVRRLEQGRRPSLAVRPLGLPAVDGALPGGGLALGGLHHVADGAPVRTAGGPCAGGAATAFAALLADRLARTPGSDRHHEPPRPRPVLWCLRAGGADDSLYGPGLAALGLTPTRLIVARAASAADVAWAMEEALRCPEVGAVVGQIPGRLDPAAGRRLALAAEAGGGAAILLRPARAANETPDEALDAPAESVAGALTRWHVGPVPSAPPSWSRPGEEPGRARWRLRLEHCRGAPPRAWTVDWDHDTGDLSVAAAPGDRSLDAHAGGAARRSA
jgi:protein ImuA